MRLISEYAMRRKTIIGTACLLLALGSPTGGCAEKNSVPIDSCDFRQAQSVCCADAIAAELLRASLPSDTKLTPADRAKALTLLAETFYGGRSLEFCERFRKKPSFATERSCFRKSSCAELATCVTRGLKRDLQRMRALEALSSPE